MRRPGKRDRLRKSADANDPSVSSPPLRRGGRSCDGNVEATAPHESTQQDRPPSVATQPGPSSHTSSHSTPPADAPALPRELVGSVALATAMCVGLIALLNSTLVSTRPATEAPPLAEMIPADDPAPRDPTPFLVTTGPIPAPATAVDGNGYASYMQALEVLPQPNGQAARSLATTDRDPGTHLNADAQRYLRTCMPALELFSRAARSTRFEPNPEHTAPFDLLQRRRLALAALGYGRMQARGGAPAKGARWALHVVALGHAQSRSGSTVEVLSGIALARLGESWVRDALTRYRWSDAELSWLDEQLAQLLEQRPADSVLDDLDALPDEQRQLALAGHTRQRNGELTQLETLRGLCRKQRGGAQ